MFALYQNVKILFGGTKQARNFTSDFRGAAQCKNEKQN